MFLWCLQEGWQAKWLNHEKRDSFQGLRSWQEYPSSYLVCDRMGCCQSCWLTLTLVKYISLTLPTSLIFKQISFQKWICCTVSICHSSQLLGYQQMLFLLVDCWFGTKSCTKYKDVKTRECLFASSKESQNHNRKRHCKDTTVILRPLGTKIKTQQCRSNCPPPSLLRLNCILDKGRQSFRIQRQFCSFSAWQLLSLLG